MELSKAKKDIKEILCWVLDNIDSSKDTNSNLLIIGVLTTITDNFRRLLLKEYDSDGFHKAEQTEIKKMHLYLSYINNLSAEEKVDWE